MTRISVFSDGSLNVTHLPVEIQGRRAFIGHDFQVDDANFFAYYPRVCNADGTPKLIKDPDTGLMKPFGLPETEKLGNAQFEKMDEKRQLFWFGLFTIASDGTISTDELKRRWADLTAGNKAFCNKHGGVSNPGTKIQYKDYINGTGNVDEPMSQENVTTCGNMVILTGHEAPIGGVPFLGVLCLDGTKLPTAEYMASHTLYEYFIHAATNCRPERLNTPNFPSRAIAPNGTFVVDPFPHLTSLSGSQRVPVPLISSRGVQSVIMGLNVRENWIAKRRIVLLDDDENPSAYVR